MIIIILLISTIKSVYPQDTLPFPQYCKYYGYPVQSHQITTQDGYVLTYFRIQQKNSTIINTLKPVLLHHTLLDSSDTWIINDQQLAPGFIWADAGYDIWFSNTRGNKYSRKHIKLNPDKDVQFWQYSFENTSKYDLPAAFKYINQITKQTIHFVGHAQGNLIMNIALAENNSIVLQYLDKYFALGPVAYQGYTAFHFIQFFIGPEVQPFFQINNVTQFMGTNFFNTEFGELFCTVYTRECNYTRYLLQFDPRMDNNGRYDVYNGHNPSGTSLMNLIHYKQLKLSKKFQHFDYGKQENLKIYKQQNPPQWSMSKITKKVRFFVGTLDSQADIVDVDLIWKQIPQQMKGFYKNYVAQHATYMWGLKTHEWINQIAGMFKDDEYQQ